jgi:hypothetical protein
MNDTDAWGVCYACGSSDARPVVALALALALTPRDRKPRQPSEHIRLGRALRPRRDRALPVALIAEHPGKARGDGAPPKEDTGVGLHGEVRALLIARDGGPGGGGDEEVVHLPRGADCGGRGEG